MSDFTTDLSETANIIINVILVGAIIVVGGIVWKIGVMLGLVDPITGGGDDSGSDSGGDFDPEVPW